MLTNMYISLCKWREIISSKWLCVMTGFGICTSFCWSDINIKRNFGNITFPDTKGYNVYLNTYSLNGSIDICFYNIKNNKNNYYSKFKIIITKIKLTVVFINGSNLMLVEKDLAK